MDFFNDKIVDVITGLFVDPIYSVRITIVVKLPKIIQILGE